MVPLPDLVAPSMCSIHSPITIEYSARGPTNLALPLGFCLLCRRFIISSTNFVQKECNGRKACRHLLSRTWSQDRALEAKRERRHLPGQMGRREWLYRRGTYALSASAGGDKGGGWPRGDRCEAGERRAAAGGGRRRAGEKMDRPPLSLPGAESGEDSYRLGAQRDQMDRASDA